MGNKQKHKRHAIPSEKARDLETVKIVDEVLSEQPVRALT